ncbi:hypothetical protein Tco_1203876 [Tanacetum coccineum]
MSNTNNTMQTQTSNAHHNAIMEASGKDRPPMLAPGIDNDIYSTVNACPNAMEMFYKMMNELVRNQCEVTNHQVNVQFLLQLQPEWKRNRSKGIVNSPPPTYDQEPAMVVEDDEMSKEKKIDKLMALISLSFKKIYKPTSNNLRTLSNTSRENQDNSLRINKGIRYDNQRAVNVVEDMENIGTQVVQQSGLQCYNCKEYGHVTREYQKSKRVKDAAYHKEKMLLLELEAYYLYLAKIQEVALDAADNSRPIFDPEPLQKVQNDDDNFNVFANDREHPEQPESVNDTYPNEQERDLLAFLIDKLKCEIDDSINRNKLLESSNKTLVDKLKGEIEDFKNKSLESSNNHVETNNNH